MTTPNKDTTAHGQHPAIALRDIAISHPMPERDTLELIDAAFSHLSGQIPLFGLIDTVKHRAAALPVQYDTTASELWDWTEKAETIQAEEQTTTPEPPARLFHSPLPWTESDGQIWGLNPGHDPADMISNDRILICDTAPGDVALTEYDLHNARYIAHACNTLPALTAEKLSMQTQVNTLRQATQLALLRLESRAEPTQPAEAAFNADLIAKVREMLNETQHQAPPAVTVAARVLNAAWDVVREYNNDDRDLTPFIDKLTAALESTEKKGTQCAA